MGIGFNYVVCFALLYLKDDMLEVIESDILNNSRCFFYPFITRVIACYMHSYIMFPENNYYELQLHDLRSKKINMPLHDQAVHRL